MKHWQWWTILAATAAACALSAAWTCRPSAPQCNFAVIIPVGLAFLVAAETVAYAVWCLVRLGRELARRIRTAG